MGNISAHFNSFFTEDRIKYISLIIFLLTAIFSIGHHQSDEYFQILEFAQYKLGYINASELPWEFHEKMRPSIQPWIAVILIKGSNAIGIENPFAIATLIRLFTALLLWTVITKLNRVLVDKYFPEKTWATIFMLSAYLLWYMPYLSVRFSSENYSALFLLLGLYYILKDSKYYKNMLFASIFLALSVLFRYQMGIAVIGIYLWLLIKSEYKIGALIFSIIPFSLVIVFGSFLDFLFYDEFVIAPYNYLKLNLIEGRAAGFGTSPWYFYILNALYVSVPPISIILLSSFLFGLKKSKTQLLTWAIIPFILIHFIIGHKEVRFLFPINYLFIFISIYGLYQYFKEHKLTGFQKGLFRFSIVLNMILLVFMTLKPANEMLPNYSYLYKNIDLGKRQIVSQKTEAYHLMAGLRSTFYTPKNIHSSQVNSIEELSTYLTDNDIDTCFYIHDKFNFIDEIDGYQFQKVYCIYPEWINSIGSFDWQSIVSTHSIYLVHKTE